MLAFGIIVVLFLIAGPCVPAGWIGTRVRWSALAFVMASALTPIVSYIATQALIPMLRAVIPPDNDGMGDIMIPYFGIVTGLVTGIVAAVIVSRRNAKAAKASIVAPSDSGGSGGGKGVRN